MVDPVLSPMGFWYGLPADITLLFVLKQIEPTKDCVRSSRTSSPNGKAPRPGWLGCWDQTFVFTALDVDRTVPKGRAMFLVN